MSQLTKPAIRQAFIRLISQRPLDKITVKDVVEESGVSRNTFYYHYQDIYALVEDLLQQEEANFSPLDSASGWKEGIIHATEFARRNRKAIYHIYNSVSHDQLDRYFAGVMGRFVESFMEKELAKIPNAVYNEADRIFVRDFYKYALVGWVTDWLQSGMKADMQEFPYQMEALFSGTMRLTLENLSRRHNVK